jgi:hypothetical protein
MFIDVQVEHIKKVKNELSNILDRKSFDSHTSSADFSYRSFIKHPMSLGVLKGSFVSGGCIGALLRGEAPNDIDIWQSTNPGATYVSEWAKLNEEYVQDIDDAYKDDATVKVNGKLITAQAVTLRPFVYRSDLYNLLPQRSTKLQLITKWYGTPDEVRKEFDYIHCTPYYDVDNDKLYISELAYAACLNKKLIVNNEKSASHTSMHKRRKEKLISQGFTV